MDGRLTVLFQQGEKVVELKGEAEAVQAALTSLRVNGLQALATFFGNSAAPGGGPSAAGIGGKSGGSSGGAVGLPSWSGPTPPLTNPAASFRFAVGTMIFPTDSAQAAVDLAGDGQPGNQLGAIGGALTAISVSPQTQIDEELKTGQQAVLLTLETERSTLALDQRAAVTLLAGNPVQPAQGLYAVDTSVPPVTLMGRIVGGRFVSDDPRTGGMVVERDLRVPLGPGVAATLPVQGLRVTFTFAPAAGSGSSEIGGLLIGSVKEADVKDRLVPALADLLSQLIQSGPQTPQAQLLTHMFDTGGCTNADGSVAAANDGVIDACEVMASGAMANVLQSDVQIWDGASYAPNLAGASKDSISLGIIFAAAAASY
jgi:hypothetical protein